MNQSSIPIKCILAVDINDGIATENGIPWKIQEDLKHFKRKTTTVPFGSNKINAIIMGRKTFESIGHTLNERLNVVISGQSIQTEHYENLYVFKSYENAVDWLNNQDIYKVYNIFVIGGKQLYDYCFNKPVIFDEIIVTKLFADYKTTLKVNIDISQYDCQSTLTYRNVVDHNDIEKGSIEIQIYQYILNDKNDEEQNYLKMLKQIITEGNLRPTRNANTYALFGKSLEFDLKKGFPLLTTKKMFLRGIFEELKFFLLGKTNTKELEEKGVNIWKGNTTREFLDNNGHKNYQEGDMGPMYGFQLLHFGAEYKGCDHNYENEGYNQLEDVINLLKTDKFSRRILMTTYNPVQSKEGVLYPCHGLTIQFGVEGKNSNELVCTMYQRSCDFALGCPFNIASYALLVHIICNIVGNNLVPGRLIMFFGDTHVYEEHLEAVNKQLKNKPNIFPRLRINKQILGIDDISNLNFNDIELINYKSHNSIKAIMIP